MTPVLFQLFFSDKIKLTFLHIIRQNGQPVLSKMAVVIQEMVEADSAGVAFSRNPITGNPEEIILNANFGLGEVSEQNFEKAFMGLLRKYVNIFAVGLFIN